jgi:hypothetical protein
MNVDKCPDPHPALRATFSRWEKGRAEATWRKIERV